MAAEIDVSSTPRPLALLAGAAAVLAGYLAGRTLFERASAVLDLLGVSPGLAAIVPLPLYVALVFAGIAVAMRLAGPAADPRPELRLSERVRSPAAAGLVLGTILVAAVYAVAVAAGWARLGPPALAAHLATGLAGYGILYAGIAYSEEVVFRGALLSLLARLMSLRAAVLLSSALFAMVHVAVNATWARLLGLVLLGVLLALLRLRARSLWPAVAAHWSFHFFSYAAVLGLPPVRVTLTGPLLLVGTADQLDAGLLAIAALGVAVAGVQAGFGPRTR